MSIRIGFAALVASLALTSCTNITPVDIAAAKRPDVVAEKNYKLGVARSAVVGEQVVRVKDYGVYHYDVDAVKADQSFALSGGGIHISVERDEELLVVGRRQIDGKEVLVIKKGSYGLQVFSDGTIHNRIINRSSPDNIEMIFEFSLLPAGAKLVPENRTLTTVDKNNFKENYEIVFNGIDGQAMRFQYREYAADNLTRPASSQDLSYPLSTHTIRFRNLSINVNSIDASHIDYTVVEDGTNGPADRPAAPKPVTKDNPV
jgi:hypothetical protein